MHGVVRRVVCSATTTKRLVVSRRHLNTTVVSLNTEQPISNDSVIEETITAGNNVQGIVSPGWMPPTVDWSSPRDLLIRAKACTGKSSAYITPAIESQLNHVEHRAKLVATSVALGSSLHMASSARHAYRRGSVGSLILAPIRESAIQIAIDVQRLTTHRKGFEVQLLVGGADKARQKKDWMESSRDLVIATPGRLRDLLTNEPDFRNGFKGCPMLVLDEADILLSMGFRDDIDAIVSFLPRSPLRKTLLFSATMPRAVRQLASWILSPNYTFINAVPPEPDLTPRRNKETGLALPCDREITAYNHIELFHTLCPTASDQLPTLLKLLTHDQLTHGPSSKVVVFCPTVQMTELFSILLRSLVEKVLPDDSTEIVKIHLKMKQLDRDRARVLFRAAGKTKNGRPTVLVTSTVRAIWADYPQVTRMIQIGIPSRETTYIHRIGRMARSVNSFTPGKGKENNGPTVRADLLLLPWEAGYMDWQLTSLPIKSLPISVLDGQLASLSSQSQSQATPTTESLTSALAEIQHRIDPADVRSVAASLLGYYLPLTPPLRMGPKAVLAGVCSWASECFHVSIPTITRFPKRFTDAFEQSIQSGKTKGLFVDGLRLAAPSPLGKARSKNRSIWEGANTRRRKPKRWY